MVPNKGQLNNNVFVLFFFLSKSRKIFVQRRIFDWRQTLIFLLSLDLSINISEGLLNDWFESFMSFLYCDDIKRFPFLIGSWRLQQTFYNFLWSVDFFSEKIKFSLFSSCFLNQIKIYKFFHLTISISDGNRKGYTLTLSMDYCKILASSIISTKRRMRC